MKTKYVKTGNFIPIFLAAMLIILMVTVGGAPVSASVLTENGIDRNHAASITMTVNTDEWYVDGATFHLYKVADLNDDLGYTYTDAFKDCSVDVNLSPNSAASDAASGLIKYVRDNNISADQSEKISNRTVTFSGLSLGLYLVQGDTATDGNRTVTYQPVVIRVPQRDSAVQEWTYNVTSHVKSAAATYTTEEKPDTSNTSSETTSTETTEKTEKPAETSKTSTPAKPTVTKKSDRSNTSSGTTPARTSSGTKTTGKKVRTGDTSRTGYYLTVVLVDAAAICLVVLLKRRSDKKRSGR